MTPLALYITLSSRSDSVGDLLLMLILHHGADICNFSGLCFRFKDKGTSGVRQLHFMALLRCVTVGFLYSVFEVFGKMTGYQVKVQSSIKRAMSGYLVFSFLVFSYLAEYMFGNFQPIL